MATRTSSGRVPAYEQLTYEYQVQITRHDGEWAINGHEGVFRGYIYHNCRCIDLEATLLDLAPSNYRAYVYAHGDAPNQNAAVEVIVGDRRLGKKVTANDGSIEFRSRDFKAGVHYVTFEFAVSAGEQVRIISHRDGSTYSMFNAIQLIPIDPTDATSLSDRRKPEDLTITLASIAESKKRNQYLFVINGVLAFKTLGGLKKYLEDVPNGSTLTWAPGCDVNEGERFLSSDADIKQFTEFCKSIGVQFVLVPAG